MYFLAYYHFLPTRSQSLGQSNLFLEMTELCLSSLFLSSDVYKNNAQL